MALVRWSPLSRMLSQWPDVWDEDLLNVSGTRDLDVYETEDEVVVRANIAGVAEDDVELTFEKGVLYINAEKTEEEGDKDKKHYSKSSWSYSYKVAVPGMIDFGAEPEAEIENGVVSVTFKKSEGAKPKRLTIKKK